MSVQIRALQGLRLNRTFLLGATVLGPAMTCRKRDQGEDRHSNQSGYYRYVIVYKAYEVVFSACGWFVIPFSSGVCVSDEPKK